MSGRVICAVALSVLVAVAAGCGGSSSNSSGTNANANTTTSSGGNHSSSNPNSANYDPATTTLKKAGLDVCNQIQSQSVGGLDQSSGLAATRSFLVAPDCHGLKTSANQITVYQFTDRQSLEAGKAKIQVAYPKGQMTTYGPVVILATGPNAAQYLADVKKALPATAQ
jgi:hypothetical protein